MASQITITAKTGPDQEVTAEEFTEVSEVLLDLANQVIWITTNGLKRSFALDEAATFTSTIDDGSWDMTLA